MNDNPSTEDLKKLGWVDFNWFVGIANNESFDKFIDECYGHIHDATIEKKNENDIVVFRFLSQMSSKDFDDLIKERQYSKIRIFDSFTESFTLNDVLDKINNEGKSSLDSRESSFLNEIHYFIK